MGGQELSIRSFPANLLPPDADVAFSTLLAPTRPAFLRRGRARSQAAPLSMSRLVLTARNATVLGGLGPARQVSWVYVWYTRWWPLVQVTLASNWIEMPVRFSEHLNPSTLLWQ